MKPYSLTLALSCLSSTLRAQFIYTINADSVKITNQTDVQKIIQQNQQDSDSTQSI
jgi:hypothetical protein